MALSVMRRGKRAASDGSGTEKRRVAAQIRAERARTIALLEDLPEHRWEREVLPGWRVREVAAHLVSTDEAALTGRLLALGIRPVPVERIEAWNDEQVGRWADRPIPALLHGLDLWGRRVARAVALPPGPVARASIPTPLGKVSPLWLGRMRIYDEWIHGHDLRRALDIAGDDDADVLETVARQMLAVIPVQTLPRLAGGEGIVRLAFTDVPAPRFAVDLGARRFGAGVRGEDAVVRGGVESLVLVAAGRDPWREAEARGDIEVVGDRAAAERFLDALIAV